LFSIHQCSGPQGLGQAAFIQSIVVVAFISIIPQHFILGAEHQNAGAGTSSVSFGIAINESFIVAAGSKLHFLMPNESHSGKGQLLSFWQLQHHHKSALQSPSLGRASSLATYLDRQKYCQLPYDPQPQQVRSLQGSKFAPVGSNKSDD